MNKVQQLFSADGRVDTASSGHKKFISIAYALLSVTQWKYIYRWFKSQRKNRNPWVDGMPWITYGAIDFLAGIIDKDFQAFEYGSGGSTIYFSNRVKKLVSIEHNEEWFGIVDKELRGRKIKNCDYNLVTATERKNTNEYYHSTTETESSFENYVKSISKFPDHHFDIVSVDGRARVQCIIEAYRKVKPGGYILLDNSERKDYFEAHMFLMRMGAKPHHFFGLVGYEPPLAQTTVWKV